MVVHWKNGQEERAGEVSKCGGEGVGGKRESGKAGKWESEISALGEFEGETSDF
jgi:hypothetical protein